MSEGQVGRVLYREILRWARKAEGVPLSARATDLRLFLSDSELAAHNHEDAQAKQQAASSQFIAGEVHRHARKGFKAASQTEGITAETFLDRGFEAFRALNSEYTRRLEDLQQQRALHSSREKILCSIGQVFRHKRHGYKGVICGWDKTCARDARWAQELGLRHDQPYYEVLPDEDESHRLFGATRISKYVAQENIEAQTGTRVLHRALHNYFTGFSRSLGRYIPSASLQYLYPDHYQALDVEPVGDDANLLSKPDHFSSALTTAKRKQILVDAG